jgi:hypothetical protein
VDSFSFTAWNIIAFWPFKTGERRADCVAMCRKHVWCLVSVNYWPSLLPSVLNNSKRITTIQGQFKHFLTVATILPLNPNFLPICHTALTFLWRLFYSLELEVMLLVLYWPSVTQNSLTVLEFAHFSHLSASVFVLFLSLFWHTEWFACSNIAFPLLKSVTQHYKKFLLLQQLCFSLNLEEEFSILPPVAQTYTHCKLCLRSDPALFSSVSSV